MGASEPFPLRTTLLLPPNSMSLLDKQYDSVCAALPDASALPWPADLASKSLWLSLPVRSSCYLHSLSGLQSPCSVIYMVFCLANGPGFQSHGRACAAFLSAHVDADGLSLLRGIPLTCGVNMSSLNSGGKGREFSPPKPLGE